MERFPENKQRLVYEDLDHRHRPIAHLHQHSLNLEREIQFDIVKRKTLKSTQYSVYYTKLPIEYKVFFVFDSKKIYQYSPIDQ